MTLSIYEQREWDRLQQRKAASLRKQPRRLPDKARDRLSAAADKAKTAPGADKVLAGYTTAARGLGKATGSTATRTVSSKHVIKEYQRAGHDIEGLAGIQQLDLSAVGAVAKLSRIRYGHSVLAAASGFGSAAVVTGGELLAGAGTVAGAGAGAASTRELTPRLAIAQPTAETRRITIRLRRLKASWRASRISVKGDVFHYFVTRGI